MISTRTTLFVLTLCIVLFSGAFVPIFSQQAFAGNGPCVPQDFNGNDLSSQDNICIPNFFGASNSVHRSWADLGVVGDAGNCDNIDQSSGLVVTGSSEGASNFQLWGESASFTLEDNGASFFIPNFQDPLPNKDIRVQLTFCELVVDPSSRIRVGIEATDNGQQSECSFVAGGDNFPTGPDTVDAIYFFDDWFCEPNPDFEDIEIFYDHTDWLLVQVVIDTWSFGEVVGGVFEGVNTGALLVAGAQNSAAWMIPVIVAGIGFAIVIARKF